MNKIVSDSKHSTYLFLSAKQHAQSLGCVRLFVTSRTVAPQAPLSMGILQARILEWVAISSSRGSSQIGIKLMSLSSPALAGRFFTTALLGNPFITIS